ncbi:MAG TPA: L,D-transpeptidase family protein [Stellaceae bacterium]|nr:L,D-transpeptidase family protein [Stellaceae bacterium]
MLLGACAATERTPAVVFSHSFPLSSDQAAVGLVGTYVASENDTLLDVARRFDLGYTQLVSANRGIDPWQPGAGRNITVPNLYLLPDGPRRGIVVNLVQNRLYYFPPDGGTVETYPIGVGVQGASTPIGTTRIVAKRAHPRWVPPASIRAERPELPAVVPPGPDNPLGDYALQLGWPSYLIHGTNKPDGVGRNASHGCLRLYPEDVERLFGEVAVGTPVRVVNEEVQTAWIGGDLYLAVYPTKEQADQLDVNEPVTPTMPPRLKQRVEAAAGSHPVHIDWSVVERAGRERTGIPVRVAAKEI